VGFGWKKKEKEVYWSAHGLWGVIWRGKESSHDPRVRERKEALLRGKKDLPPGGEKVRR